MDVWRITVAALRRWYVLIPLLGLTVLLVMGVGSGVKKEFDVTGATMLVPGRTVTDVPNPYGGPADANNAVAIVLNSPETRREIADQGLIATYEVSPQSRSNIMDFQVRGDSPEQAIDTGMAVFRMAAMELRERQSAAGIPLGSQYSIDVLQPPAVSAEVAEGKLRNMAVVGVLGAGLSLAIAVLFDDIVGLVRRRRRRRREAGRTEADEPERVGAEPERPAAPSRTEPRLPDPDEPPTDAKLRDTAVSDAR